MHKNLYLVTCNKSINDPKRMCQLMECTSFSISKLSGPVTFFIPFKCICHIEVCVKIFSITVICFYFYDVINTLHVISLSFITLSTIV